VSGFKKKLIKGIKVAIESNSAKDDNRDKKITKNNSLFLF
tara:strand:- start:355 stop:474 length:120 start_codon:yes stop_codon:yes gene_type:complete